MARSTLLRLGADDGGFDAINDGSDQDASTTSP